MTFLYDQVLKNPCPFPNQIGNRERADAKLVLELVLATGKLHRSPIVFPIQREKKEGNRFRSTNSSSVIAREKLSDPR